MGVTGLTTYINKRRNKYFEPYKLRNGLLVIDGNSLAAVTYIDGKCGCSAFGGDYDRYAHKIEKVLKNFYECNITPIVVFDGAYEPKKFRTIKKRSIEKVKCLEKVTPASVSTKNFPLLMRQVLRDKLAEMEIAIVQSDFEADGEIAALSRKLSCPVMSNDSDFFIFDVPYIPFYTVNLFSYEVDNDTKELYISCEIYRMERLIESIGGLSKPTLPLLATLLGNDYIERSTFKNFFSHLKLDSGASKSQKQVGGLLNWLRKESFQSALCKVLSWVPQRRKRMVSFQIKSVVRGYTQIETPLEAYLPKFESAPTVSPEMRDLENQLENSSVNDVNYDDFKEDEGLETENYVGADQNGSSNEGELSENEEELSENEEEQSENEEELSENEEDVSENVEEVIPHWILEESRKCNIHPCVITLITVNTYFFTPQIENYSLPHAGELSLPLLRSLAGLLIGNEQNINYYARFRKSYEKCSTSSTTSTKRSQLPDIRDVPGLAKEDRKRILLDILDLDSAPEGYTEEWILFILALIYWVRNSATPTKSFILYTVLVMLIAVSVMDSKISHTRQKAVFLRQNRSEIRRLKKPLLIKSKPEESMTVAKAVSNIPTRDCLLIFESFLPYFHFNIKYDNKSFCQDFVHQFIEFQTVLDMVMILNSVLYLPFPRCHVGSLYNGTFLYNFGSNMKKRKNPFSYMETFLAPTPSLLLLFKTLVESLTSYIPQFCFPEKTGNSNQKSKSKKRRKKPENEIEEEKLDKLEEEENAYIDPNNRFSFLCGNPNVS